jgi:hypothetical protein
MSKKKTTEEFVKEANLKHNNQYDYSKAEYSGAQSKLIISCKTHGDFQQSAISHLRGAGCPKCANKKRNINNIITEKDFLKRSKQKFKQQFDYSRMTYIDYYKSINLVCTIHNKSFNISPIKHIHNKTGGCPICGKERYNKARSMPLEKFIRLANEIHKNKYDYSKVDYRGIKHHVTIICPIHGEFIKSPMHHLAGQGCKLCSNEKKAKQHILPFETFEKRAKAIFGDRYDYKNCEYTRITAPITLVCSQHGKFTVNAKEHLNGQHCPLCRGISKGELQIVTVLHKYNIAFEREKKFDDLKNIKPLRFDFYLPDYNLCLEYMGIQHYKVRPKFRMTVDSLRNIQKRDKLKEKYCMDNNINYMKIAYYDYKKIEQLLVNKLLKNKLTN